MTTLSDRKRRSAVFHPRPRKSASRRTAAKASVHRTEKRTKEMIWIVAPGRDATSVVMAKSSRWFRRRVRPRRPTLHSAQVLATRFVIAKWARDGVYLGNKRMSVGVLRPQRSSAALEMVAVRWEAKERSKVPFAVQQEVSTLSIGNDAYLSTRSQQIASFALRRFR